MERLIELIVELFKKLPNALNEKRRIINDKRLCILRTSSNQNSRQNQVDSESEENAIPGDLRHGVDTSSKHYSVKMAI